MLLLKVCGITNSADAKLAVDLGADLIGIIFAEKSARKVTLEKAEEITEAVRRRCKLVGVFQNQQCEFIEDARNRCRLDFVQLHGEETPDVARKHKPSIKALTFGAHHELPPFSGYGESSDYLLFDRSKGSSDEGFLDQALTTILASPPAVPFFMAGGINKLNVGSVIGKLKSLESFAGIDVASAIESSPGHKDPKLMTDFITAFKEASHHAISR